MGIYDDGNYFSGTTISRPFSYPTDLKKSGFGSKVEFDQSLFRLLHIFSMRGWLHCGKSRFNDLYIKAVISGRVYSKGQLNGTQSGRPIVLNKEDRRLICKAKWFSGYVGPKLASLLDQLPRPSEIISKKAEFQMFKNNPFDKFDGLVDSLSAIKDVIFDVKSFVAYVKNMREKFYAKLSTAFSTELSSGAKRILDISITMTVISFVVWIFKKSSNIIDMAVSAAMSLLGLAVSYIAKKVKKLFSYIVKTSEYSEALNSKEQAQFQASSSTVIVSLLLCVIGSVITGREVSRKDAFEFIRVSMPGAGVLEALFDKFTDLSSWIISIYDPEHPWAVHRKIHDKFFKIKARVEARQTDEKFAEKLVANKKLYLKIKKDFEWLNANQLKIYDMNCLKGKSAIISLLRTTAASQYQMARESSGLFKNRSQPLVIWLYGKPGQGKSDVIPILRKMILSKMKESGEDEYWNGFDDSDALMYSKSSASPYYEGYKNQPFMLLDDWGQIQTPEAIARDAADLVTLVNTAPAPLNMAFSEKGNVYFNSRVIFVTSNLVNFKNFKMADIGALGRRITYALRVNRTAEIPPGNCQLTLKDINEAWTFTPVGEIGGGPHSLDIPSFKTNFPEGPRHMNISELADKLTDYLKTRQSCLTFAERVQFQCGHFITNEDENWEDNSVIHNVSDEVQEEDTMLPKQKFWGQYCRPEPMVVQYWDESKNWSLTQKTFKYFQTFRRKKIVPKGNPRQWIGFIYQFLVDNSLKLIADDVMLGDFYKGKFPAKILQDVALMSANDFLKLLGEKQTEVTMAPMAGSIARDDDLFEDDWFVPEGLAIIRHPQYYLAALQVVYGNCENVNTLTSYFSAFHTNCLSMSITFNGVHVGMESALSIDNCVGAWKKRVPGVGPPTKLEVRFQNVLNVYRDHTKLPYLPLRGFEKNYAADLVVADNWGIDMKTFRLFCNILTAGIVVKIIKNLFDSIFPESPAWFNSSAKQDIIERRGGDRLKGPFSPSRKASRYKDYFQYLEDPNASWFQSVGSHQRDISVARNTYVVKWCFVQSATFSQAIFMDDRQIVFPWHTYQCVASDKAEELLEIQLYPDHPSTGVKTCLTVPRGSFSIRRPDSGRDLGMLIFKKPIMSGIRSLWGMVPSFKDRTETIENLHRILVGVDKGRAVMVSEGPYQSVLVKNSPKIITMEFDGKIYEDTGLTYYLVYDAKGDPGDCGFAYLSSSGSDKPFKGMHGARCGDDAFMIPIYAEDSVLSQAQGFPPDLEERLVFPSSGAQHIPGAKLVAATKDLKSFTSPPYSKYFPRNPEYIQEVGFENFKVPAVMDSIAVNNRLEATMNFGETRVDLDRCSKSPEWSWGFCPIRKTFNSFLTFEEALFGNPEKGLPSFATSSKFVGHFFTEKKSELVDFKNKTYHPKLKERVDKYFRLAAKEHVIPLVAQFAKDELLDKEKVEQRLCRLINGHDFAYNIFLRMLTGQFAHLVTSHPARTVACLGINPLSNDWKMLADQAFTHPHVIAGDLSKQEATTNEAMKTDFINFVKSFYALEPADEQIMVNGLQGLNSFYFEKQGHIYTVVRGHSSGHFLTALYNSYCTWWLHKDCFESLVPELSFSDHVVLRTLGDDSIGSVSEEAASRFNMKTISLFAKKTYGIKYTDPKKSLEVPEFLEMKDAEFLGRSFSKIGSKLVGPLRRVAIIDMIAYSINIPGMTQYEVDAVRLEAAMREASIHGKKYYNKQLSLIRSTMKTRNRTVPYLPPYEDMLEKVMANWNKTDYGGISEDPSLSKALH